MIIHANCHGLVRSVQDFVLRGGSVEEFHDRTALLLGWRAVGGSDIWMLRLSYIRAKRDRTVFGHFMDKDGRDRIATALDHGHDWFVDECGDDECRLCVVEGVMFS